MADMMRGRSQVLFKYLPGTVFSEKGTWFLVNHLTLRELSANTDLLLQNVRDFVSKWSINEDVNVDLYPKQDHLYYFAEIEEVHFDVYPLVFYCTKCWNVHPYYDLKQMQRQNTRLVCEFCQKGKLRQYPYALVHMNGDIQPLNVPTNTGATTWKAKYDGIRMYDTRSFATATWYQYKKRRHIGNLGSRNSRMPIAKSMRNAFMGGTHLSEGDVYYPALRSFVNLNQDVLQKRKEHDYFAYYQIGALLQVPSVNCESYASNFDKKENQLLKLLAGASEIQKQMLMEMAKQQNIPLDSHDDVVVQEVDTLFGGETPIEEIKKDRSLHEFIHTWLENDAISVSDRIVEAQSLNDIISETSFLDAMRELQNFGVETAALVENFPVLMMAMGYTRKSFDRQKAILNPIRQKVKERDKIIIPVLKNENEAVIFKMDSRRVLAWLVLNNWVNAPESNKVTVQSAHAQIYKACKFSIINQEELAQFKPKDCLEDPALLATVMTFRLLHSFSHGLFQAGKAILGLDIDSLSEYLFPSSLAAAIYVTKLEGGGMGALTAAFDNDLSRWIRGVYEKVNTCLYDPVCHEHTGACHACMYLKFSCTHFNHGLTRNLLIDGVDPDYDLNRPIIGYFSPLVDEQLKKWGSDGH
ncbi:hypothetical protein [Gorillibacterium sp. CAU 1737]|uniref:hypothetical protein n=1 Tax=Gorillibacterium sp. CAU 1737 TaxID=3140362 RepID=UPI00325FED3D